MGFRVCGLGIRIKGSGFRVPGLASLKEGTALERIPAISCVLKKDNANQDLGRIE